MTHTPRMFVPLSRQSVSVRSVPQRVRVERIRPRPYIHVRTDVCTHTSLPTSHICTNDGTHICTNISPYFPIFLPITVRGQIYYGVCVDGEETGPRRFVLVVLIVW